VFELELSLSSSELDELDELELLDESEAKPVLVLTLIVSACFANSGSTSCRRTIGISGKFFTSRDPNHLQDSQPFLRKLWPSANRFMVYNRKICFAAKVLGHRNCVIQVQHNMPVAARNKYLKNQKLEICYSYQSPSQLTVSPGFWRISIGLQSSGQSLCLHLGYILLNQVIASSRCFPPIELVTFKSSFGV
jgi:hypothetical protein